MDSAGSDADFSRPRRPPVRERRPPDTSTDGVSDWQTDRTRAPIATKIVVAGGFGVGKTTFVGSVSEITPSRPRR